MLFSLSVKNFRKSVRDYSVYFFTLILGVAVFYIFNAIETQTAMMEVSRTKADIMETMNKILAGVSVVISLILGYLIVYASQFMLKKRKKEFAVYLTLGMGRRQVAGILWIETVFMGVISLAAGLGLGIGLSQFVSLLVSDLFQADMSRFVFTVSKGAIGKSLLYFLLIYLVVMLFNTWAVSRAKLIDFFTAEKKKERNLLKQPVVCVVLFLAAWCILGYAYYNVTVNADNLTTEFDVLRQMLFGILGTFLVFWSVSGFFAAAARRCRRIYYKELNSFAAGEISKKLNSAVISGGIICLLVFMTICILSTVFTRKDYKEKQAAELAPVSISMWKSMENGESIEAVMEKQGIEENLFRDTVSIFSYETPELTEGAVLGSFLEENFSKYGEEFAKSPVEAVSLSDYNKLAALYGLSEYSLEEDEYLIVANAESGVNLYNRGLADNTEIQVNGKTYRPKYTSCQAGYLMMSYDTYNFGFLVLPDTAGLSGETKVKQYMAANYREDSKAFRQEMDTEFQEKLNGTESQAPVYISTQSEIYDNTIAGNAMYIFLGLYLGISFLISGSAVLALKMLSDAADSRENYAILRKLGCGEKKIRKSLWKQNGIFFFFPLLLAGIHSVFGIQVCNQILSIYGTESIWPGLRVAVVLVALIYGGYFLVAQVCCGKIVRE